MKKSQIMHIISIISGIWGFLALIGAWSTPTRNIFGFTQEHCYLNAIILILISISAGVCAIYRLHLENYHKQ